MLQLLPSEITQSRYNCLCLRHEVRVLADPLVSNRVADRNTGRVEYIYT